MLQRASDRNDIMERIRLDFKFHQVLVELSGNQVFTDIQEQLTKKGRLIQIQHYSENGATFCNLAGHLDILQALNDRNTPVSKPCRIICALPMPLTV